MGWNSHMAMKEGPKPAREVRIRLAPSAQRVFLQALEYFLGKKLDKETEQLVRQLALTLMVHRSGPRRRWVLPGRMDIQEFLRNGQKLPVER